MTRQEALSDNNHRESVPAIAGDQSAGSADLGAGLLRALANAEPKWLPTVGQCFNVTISDAERALIVRAVNSQADMLAALKACDEALSCEAMKGVWGFLYTHGFKWTGPVVDMLKVKAAIAKAEGR